MRSILFAVSVAVIVACSTQREEASVWTMNSADAPCAPSADAKPALLATWGGGAARIDGMSCTLDEVVSIDAPNTKAVDSCCYPATCTSALTPVEQFAFFSATCHRSACGLYPDPTTFNVPDVTKALAAKLPRCTLTGAPPATKTTQECTYRVDGRYTCSSSGG